MRPVLRRSDASDLEAARRMVSTAEREALERAEELLKAATHHEAVQVDAMRQRAEAAESEVEELRARCAELESGEGGAILDLRLVNGEPEPEAEDESGVPPGELLHRFVERMSVDVERLMGAAGEASARLHRQAEEDMTLAKEESARILAIATSEAEQLLATAVNAIERDANLAHAAKDQAERDAAVAIVARQEAESALEQARADAERIREEGRREAIEALDAAREQGRAEADEMRKQAAGEVAQMRSALDQARASLDHLAAAESEPAAEPEAAPGIDARRYIGS